MAQQKKPWVSGDLDFSLCLGLYNGDVKLRLNNNSLHLQSILQLSSFFLGFSQL